MRDADDPLSDTDYGERGACQRGCNADGWVELYLDADGKLLGTTRSDPRTEAIALTDLFRPATTDDVDAGLADEPGEPIFDGTQEQVTDLVATHHTYPCPIHRPEQFLRWSRGCYRPNHRGCDQCRAS